MLNLNLFKSNNRSMQEQLVLFGTLLPCFFLIPFTFYRSMIGDYSIAAVDLMISVGLITIVVQTLFNKKNKVLNTIAVACFMSGVAWVMDIKGLNMVFWAFPTVGFTYFIMKSYEALSVNIVFIAVITLIFADELTKQQTLSIYPSLILVCLFGFAFSLCAEGQNKKLLRRVSVDTLTGVKSRRSFDDKVYEILESHKRHPNPVSMLIIDLDHFKKINDSFGHKQVDQIVKDLSKTVQSIVRTTDYVYRFGGEEFVVIANYSTLENAAVLAESIREFVTQTASLSKYDLTVSIGVAEIKDRDDADSWFRRADRALYESKESGRNKVTLAKVNESNLNQTDDLNIISKEIKSVPIKTKRLICPRENKDLPKEVSLPRGQRAIDVLNILDKA